MNTENLDPVFEMYQELDVMNFLLIQRFTKHLKENNALQMMDNENKVRYVIEKDKYYRDILTAKLHLVALMDEELDAHIPRTLLWQELTSK